MPDTDVIVIGAGLAGLVAATEAVAAGKRVVVVDQESRENLGGQAFWSLGGLFLVDTPEQRRMGIKDSHELAWSDWKGTAGWDRLGSGGEDYWGKQWARAYVEFAAGEMRAWLSGLDVKFFPLVGWAERGDGTAGGHGNSVPRFHVTWGTGPGICEPFVRLAKEAEVAGRLRRVGEPRLAVATSKTFRQLARIAGAAPSSEGVHVRRVLRLEDVRELVPRLAGMTATQRSRIPGVSEGRSEQMVAGAVVAEAAMELLDVDELVVCPWALREGIILRRMDGLPR